MSTGKNNLKNDSDLDEVIRGALGLSDEQLMEELYKAEQAIDDSQIPPSPKDGFQQILNKIEQQNIKGYRETHPSEKKDTPDGNQEKVHWIFSKRFRVLLTAAILIGVLMGVGLTATGKRNFEYVQSEREGKGNDIALNNDENKIITSELEEAYQKIHDELGIAVLKFGYMPADMEFVRLEIDNRHAMMIFNYKDNKLYFVQDLKTDSSSSNLKSNRKTVKTIKNNWFEYDIKIKSITLDDGTIEYSTEIKIDDAFYYIDAVMDLEEFIKIIEDINYY